MIDAASLLLAAYLAVSALGKFAGLPAFVVVLETTYRLPVRGARVAGPLVPATELLSALLVALPGTRLFGLIVASAWLLAMTAFSGVTWASGRSGECGCLGSLAKTPLGPASVARAAGLSTVAVALVLAMR